MLDRLFETLLFGSVGMPAAGLWASLNLRGDELR